MGRKTTSVSFKNTTISLNDMSLTEYNKDDFEEFKIMDILREWDGIDGVSITIKKDSGFSPSDEEADEE